MSTPRYVMFTFPHLNRVADYFFLLGLVVVFGSCLGPRKINKWVDQYYAGTSLSQPKKTSEYISVSYNVNSSDQIYSTTEKKTGHLLPLIFYWQYDYRNTCMLNPKIAIHNFTATVLTYAGKKGLKQKLNGQRVELAVKQIPDTFAIDDKGHVIWVIYAFGWDILTIQPELTDMVIEYRVLQGDVESKKEVITIPNKDKILGLKQFQSLRKRTNQYLEQYDANIVAMGKLVIDQLMNEL